MPFIYYWRGDNYRCDLDYGAGYHLNQSNRLLHQIEIGDSLWAFTRRANGLYVLAAELVVSAKTLNPPNYRYGRYRVWGHLRRSRYFRTEGQPDISDLLRNLSIRSRGEIIGRAFQGHAAVRRLSEEDHRILDAYARHLPLEPRAALLPEERLEALLFSRDEEAVETLLRNAPAGLSEERQQYLLSHTIQRDRELVEELRDLYDGRCQICRWAPRTSYGVELCEGHHVRWLSRGGEDTIQNMVLICPNHHRAIHRCDAPFDFEVRGFKFRSLVESLAMQHHQLVIS